MSDSTIINPFPTITFAEIVDIIFVAVLLYTAIVWARQTRAAFVVRGILILGGIYIIARYLDLQMTAWVFQGFFAIFLIMIVVIFQEELRQFFERIAVWSLARKRVPALGSTTSDILVRTLSDLAKEHVGALMVIRGNDPLERHITGGIPLDGKLSGPLLKSIFDPHSPGHDGAVLVEQDSITRFAAHLPLSKNLTQLVGVGTRHSAALGLAELTDALCIVVSEERGEISIARDGRLRRLTDPATLSAELERFLHETRPGEGDRRSFWYHLLREHWAEKIASLFFVSALWLAVVPGARPLEQTFRVPVHVANLPPELVVDEVKPKDVEVKLSGVRREFYLFNPRFLRITIDGSLASAGRK